ncbi:MAG TPA: DJ-1/PfpI family protein [Acidimicrobiales bacterium]|nr:DJ-1/PfpI family protein [Acidimicrobiales bacterium]
MDIAIFIFDRFTALDAVGPYETLSRLPDATVTFVAAERGLVRTDVGSLGLMADASIEELTEPDVVVVPGGPGQVLPMGDEATLAWLRHAHEHTQWTTSVCTGSLILAAAGLLEGKRATTHWQGMEFLAATGVEVVDQRVVFDGKIVTAAGVSAGIDMGLALAAHVAGDEVAQAIQLGIEYDPQPPFDAGSRHKAPPAVVELLEARSRFRDAS